MRWFRRRRPAPEPVWTIAIQDAQCANDVGLSYLDWMDLIDERRAWYRANRIVIKTALSR